MESAITTNTFKDDFKYFKKKCPPPDLSKVLDFSKGIGGTSVMVSELGYDHGVFLVSGSRIRFSDVFRSHYCFKPISFLQALKASGAGPLTASVCSPEETIIAGLMKPPSEWNIYELLDKPGRC